MKVSVLRSFPVIPVLLLLLLFVPQGVQTAEASQDLQVGSTSRELQTASAYYYFKTPANNATFQVGDEIPVSFYAGVVNKTTRMDAWGRPSIVEYAEMPVTFKVLKGNTEIYSQEFTYTRGTTIETTYTPTTTGKLKLQIFGRPMSLTAVDQVLQDTITINVKAKKPSEAQKVKPSIAVERTAKKEAEITCTNDSGYGMMVYRATKKNGNYTLVKKTTKNTFTDKGLSASKVYYYKVRLFAKSGKKTYLSKWSAVKQAGKFKSGVTLSYSKSKGVKVSWQKKAGAGYYLVSRNNVGTKGEYDVIACEGADTTTYFDKDVKKGKTYYYAVVAFKGDDTPVAKYMSNAYKIKIP